MTLATAVAGCGSLIMVWKKGGPWGLAVVGLVAVAALWVYLRRRGEGK